MARERLAWVLGGIEAVAERNDPFTPERACLCRHNAVQAGATFVAMVESTDLREGGNLASSRRAYGPPAKEARPAHDGSLAAGL